MPCVVERLIGPITGFIVLVGLGACSETSPQRSPQQRETAKTTPEPEPEPEPEPRRFATGPLRLMPAVSLLPSFDWETYASITNNLNPEWPWLREQSGTADSRFGFNFVVGANLSWRIDPRAPSDASLRIDRDADGSLADEQPIALGEAFVETTFEHSGMTLPVAVRLAEVRGEPALELRREHYRDGRVTLADSSVAFRIQATMGSFAKQGSVLFDLNGDGVFDDGPLSDELFAGDSPASYVSLGERHWSFEIDERGDALTLALRDDVDGPRPSIAPGAPAPEFKFNADNGQAALSDLRGSPVILEFFASGCGFSREAGDELATMAPGLEAAGVALLSISTEASAAEERSFADSVGKRWPVVVGPNAERISQLYRVIATPTLVLIDKRGVITGRGSWHELREEIESQI